MDLLRSHIERTLAGDKNAFAEVVARFKGMAMAVAMRRLDNRALAEEAVQEAFARAFERLSQLENPETFPGWFRTILHRKCMLAKRRQAQYLPLSEQEILSADVAEYDPFTVVTRQLERQQVHDILLTLPPTFREACIQRYVHGRPYKEIAESLDLPLGTVKRRLHDVRDRIYKDMAPQRRRGISVGFLPISDHLLIMAAHHLHNGRVFDITLRKYLSWGALVQALNNELLDAALIMAPLAMALRNQGAPIRYVLDCHHDGSAVTMQPGLKQSAHFGSRMALPHHISTHHLLLLLMHGSKAQNLPLSETSAGYGITTEYICPSYVIGSMRNQTIDGFSCSEPWGTKSEAQGLGRVVARSQDIIPGHCCCILVVREAFARAHGARLGQFLDLLEATGEHLAAHPRNGAEILTSYTGVNRHVAEQVLCNRHITFNDLRPDFERTTRLMQLAVEAEILRRPCDIESFLGQS